MAPSQDPTIGIKKAVEMGHKKHMVTYHRTGIIPETNISPEKRDPWKRWFLLETIIFRGELLVLGSVMGDSDEKSRYTSLMFNFKKV